MVKRFLSPNNLRTRERPDTDEVRGQLSTLVETDAARQGAHTRIREFLNCRLPSAPCLVVDLASVERHLFELRMSLPSARIVHAVQVCPAPEVLRVAVGLGCRFDANDLDEVDLCLAQRIRSRSISYTSLNGNPAEIADAHDRGVRLFGVESEQDLEHIAAMAPGSAVFCRISLSHTGMFSPLVETVTEVLATAQWLGLRPYGVAFRLDGVPEATDFWRELLVVFARGVQEAFAQRVGGRDLRLMVEPGRSILAEAEVAGDVSSSPFTTYCI